MGEEFIRGKARLLKQKVSRQPAPRKRQAAQPA